jgi:hypothetical protein
MPMRIDETRHRTHTFRVDDPACRSRRLARSDGGNFTPAHNNVTAFNDRTVRNDDACISDRKILRKNGRNFGEHQTDQCYESESLHRIFLRRVDSISQWLNPQDATVDCCHDGLRPAADAEFSRILSRCAFSLCLLLQWDEA